MEPCNEFFLLRARLLVARYHIDQKRVKNLMLYLVGTESGPMSGGEPQKREEELGTLISFGLDERRNYISFTFLPSHSRLFDGDDQYSPKGIKLEILFIYLLFSDKRLLSMKDALILTYTFKCLK